MTPNARVPLIDMVAFIRGKGIARIGHVAFGVYCAAAGLADPQTGLAWLDADDLSERTGEGVKDVLEALKALKDAGMVLEVLYPH